MIHLRTAETTLTPKINGTPSRHLRSSYGIE